MPTPEQETAPLLPTYLDEGSAGDAVDGVIALITGTDWLHVADDAHLHELMLRLVPDSLYGTCLGDFVEAAQRYANTQYDPDDEFETTPLFKLDVDRNLGPATRAMFSELFDVNFGGLRGTADNHTWAIFPGDKRYSCTPGEKPAQDHSYKGRAA